MLLFYCRFLGRIQRPPRTSEINIKTIEIHEKIVLSVAKPIVRKAKPSTKKTVEYPFLFIVYFSLSLLQNLKNYYETNLRGCFLMSIQKNQSNRHSQFRSHVCRSADLSNPIAVQSVKVRANH